MLFGPPRYRTRKSVPHPRLSALTGSARGTALLRSNHPLDPRRVETWDVRGLDEIRLALLVISDLDLKTHSTPHATNDSKRCLRGWFPAGRLGSPDLGGPLLDYGTLIRSFYCRRSHTHRWIAPRAIRKPMWSSRPLKGGSFFGRIGHRAGNHNPCCGWTPRRRRAMICSS